MDLNDLQREKTKNLKVFNEAVEYFDRSNGENEFELNGSASLDSTSILLQELMLSELDNLKGIIGNDPEPKINAMTEDEKELFKRFIHYYSYCPICNQKNHIINLKKLYFNEDQELITSLKIFMENKNQRTRKYNILFGIPCCTCFKKFFKEE
jgi:hypothetical protein